MPLVFHVSDTRVEINGLTPDAERGLRAVWALARPMLPARYVVRYDIAEDACGYTLHSDGEIRATSVPSVELLTTVEGVLYHDIQAWTPPRRVMLHAAAVHLGGVTFVLVGVSGAGKSSIAFALLERGARYLTDELTLFDGARVWGVPRAPQLDPMPPGARLPEGFPAADLESYVFQSRQGPRVLPILPLDASRVAPAPYPATTARLVFPRRAARTELHPLTPTAALQGVHVEIRGAAALDVGPLLRHTPVALDWSTPTEAADALVAFSGHDELSAGSRSA